MMYLQDSYKKEFETEVKEVYGNLVVLEDTIFYPEGGGQLSDEGKLTSENGLWKVLKARKQEGKIVHELDKEGLKVGEKVKCVLDWDKRYRMMRSHTAAHIISAIFNKETSALITGNQIGFEKIRIDFSLDNFDKEKIKEYIEEANKKIKQNLDVTSYEMKREEIEKKPEMVKLAMGLPPGIKILRIVKIGDVDEQPDAGTHVKNTREIGELEFLGCDNKGKNNRRVYVKLKE